MMDTGRDRIGSEAMQRNIWKLTFKFTHIGARGSLIIAIACRLQYISCNMCVALWVRWPLSVTLKMSEGVAWAPNRAGLTIMPVVPWEPPPPPGAPDQLQNFSHAVLTLNVWTWRLKRLSTFFLGGGEKSVHLEKHPRSKSWLRV